MVKKCNILIFNLVSENEVKGQGRGVKVKGHDVKVKCLIFNQVSENEVKSQSYRVKVTRSRFQRQICHA